MTRRDTSTLAALVGLFLLATALATRWLTADLLYVDEWWSIYKSGGGFYAADLPEIWRRLTEVDPGGMGAAYYYALGGWEALVGASPFAVRAFSVVWGVLAIAMTYRLGAHLFQRRIGLYAACFLAGSAFFIDFMHEARAYTMVVFAVAVAFYAYWRAHNRPTPRLTDYALLSVSLALVAYTHYVALAAIGAMGVYHLLFAPKNRRWVYLLLAMGVGGALYLPWLGVLLDVVNRGVADANRQAASMDAWQAVQQVAVGFSNNAAQLLAFMVFCAALIWRNQAGRLLILWVVVGLGLVMMVNARTAFLVHPRYLIFLWPALAILCGVGLRQIEGKWYTPALLVLWLAFGAGMSLTPDFSRGMYGAIYRPPSAGIDAAMRVVQRVSTDADVTLFHIAQPTKEPFASFVVGYLMHDVAGRGEQFGWMNSSFAQDDAGYLAAAQTALGDAKRVYTVRVPELSDTAQTRVVEYALSEGYADCGAVISRDDVRFNVFVRRPDELSVFRESAPYGFEGDSSARVTLTLMSEPWSDDGDESLLLLLGWARDNRFEAERYSVSVQILDANNGLVAQHDAALPTGRFGCTHAFLPTQALPAGEYRVMVTVYERATGGRLSLSSGAGDALELGTFRREG